MRCSLLFSILLAGTVSVLGLKGSFPRRVERRLRVLQGPPAPKEGEVSAGEPKAGETKAVEPKAGEPKAGETKADGPKDGERPKGKKCKKAPKVSPPTQTVADAPDSSPTADDDAPFCLQGEASAEECQAAKGGKLPKGHKSIHGNAEIRVSYLTGTKVEDVLNMVEEVIRSETAAEFLGCDSIEETASRKYRRWQQEEEAAEEEENLRVTGVDFQKVEISDEGKYGICAHIHDHPEF